MNKKAMILAWMFVKNNGLTIQEALRVAWLNVKLRKAMNSSIVQFRYRKIDGTIREASGTLIDNLLPPIQGLVHHGKDVQTYFDVEQRSFRCFKKINLLNIV